MHRVQASTCLTYINPFCRWVVGGRWPTAITANKPCSGLHVHHPDDFAHWVVNVEVVRPSQVLTKYLYLLPRHLRREQLQHMLANEQHAAMNPFVGKGVHHRKTVPYFFVFCIQACQTAKRERGTTPEQHLPQGTILGILLHLHPLIRCIALLHRCNVKSEDPPHIIKDERQSDDDSDCVAIPAPPTRAPARERRLLLHRSRPLNCQEMQRLREIIWTSAPEYGIWEPDAEAEWFQALRAPSSGLEQTRYDQVVGLLLRGLKGSKPFYVTPMVKQVCFEKITKSSAPILSTVAAQGHQMHYASNKGDLAKIARRRTGATHDAPHIADKGNDDLHATCNGTMCIVDRRANLYRSLESCLFLKDNIHQPVSPPQKTFFPSLDPILTKES